MIFLLLGVAKDRAGQHFNQLLVNHGSVVIDLDVFLGHILNALAELVSWDQVVLRIGPQRLQRVVVGSVCEHISFADELSRTE